MSSFSGVTFVWFRFRHYNFIEAAALRSIVLRYAGGPTATCVSSFFPFDFFEMPLFLSMLCTIAVFSLYGEKPYVFPSRVMFFYHGTIRRSRSFVQIVRTRLPSQAINLAVRVGGKESAV